MNLGAAQQQRICGLLLGPHMRRGVLRDLPNFYIPTTWTTPRPTGAIPLGHLGAHDQGASTSERRECFVLERFMASHRSCTSPGRCNP